MDHGLEGSSLGIIGSLGLAAWYLAQVVHTLTRFSMSFPIPFQKGMSLARIFVIEFLGVQYVVSPTFHFASTLGLSVCVTCREYNQK